MQGNFDNSFSPELIEIITKIGSNNLLLPKDFLYCILSEKSSLMDEIFEKFDINKESIFKELSDIRLPDGKTNRKNKIENPQSPVSQSTNYILLLSDKIVTKFGHSFIDKEHIVFAFLSYNGKNADINPVKNILLKHGMTEKEFRKYFIMVASLENKDYKASPETKSEKENNSNYEKNRNNLISYGFIESVNERVKKTKDKIFGREKEIKRSIQILCRKKKKNVMVLGESGTGKTALIDGIVNYIIDGKAPKRLSDAEIFSINIGNIVAGTKYRGQFEDRMKIIINFFDTSKKLSKNNIMFIDEMHMMMSAGSAEGSVSASNILKPKLSSGDIQCIGATTSTDFKKNIQKDDALVRRFSLLTIDEPSKEETINILNSLKEGYEKHHDVIITPESINEIVYLADRYIKSRHFPDKAIDILDEACSKIVIDEIKILSKEVIEEVVSHITGIPLSSIDGSEKDALLTLEQQMFKTVVGQEDAINKICHCVKRSRVGLKDENKPIGVFLFVGKTGTGKSLVAKTLSECLFGKDKLIRLDMSEYMEKHTTSKIIGAPPSYVGYEDGSAFADQVRKKPYSIILLDEIEKAHNDVFNLFLQIFDEGRMTDSFGRLVDFRNTVIIMTSNLAAAKIKKQSAMGFGGKPPSNKKEDSEKYYQEKVEEFFSPEFVNRIDEIVIFNDITIDLAKEIFAIEFNKTRKRLEKIGFEVEITQGLIDFICEKGFSEKFGARPMARTIQKQIESALTHKILEENPEIGSTIVLIDKKADEEKVSISFRKIKTESEI